MTDSDDLVHLSTGGVLRAVAAPVWLIQEAARRVPKPRVPVKLNADKGYEEEDENDPAFREALEAYSLATATAANDTMLLLGTQVVEVPDGFERITDEGW